MTHHLRVSKRFPNQGGLSLCKSRWESHGKNGALIRQMRNRVTWETTGPQISLELRAPDSSQTLQPAQVFGTHHSVCEGGGFFHVWPGK